MAFAGTLKQSTAVDVLIGPFIDDSDGKTAETGLTIAQADVKLSKNGQTLAQKNDDTAASHDSDGYYNCELDATDTNTLGQLTLIVNESGALPVRLDFQIVTANWFDTMCSTDQLDVNVTNIEGSDATDQIRDAVVDDATRIDASAMNTLSGHDPGETIMGATDLDTEMGRIDVAVSTRSSLTTAQVNAECDTAISDAALATAAALAVVDGNVDSILTDTNELQSDDVPGLIAALNDPTAAAIADAVWDEAQADHTAAGSFGLIASEIATIDGIVDDILVDTAEIGAAGAGLTAVPWNAAWDAEVQSECADALTAFDPPTVAQLNARTLVAANYFDAAADQVTVATNNDKTGYRLSATGVDDIHDEVIEGALTYREITRIALSVLAGESTGGGTGTLRFRNVADTADRVVATVDANQNRTGITLDGS